MSNSASLEDIETCYRVILGREPDNGGLAHFRHLIAEGLTRKDLMRAFLTGNEFDARPEAERARAIAAFETEFGVSPFPIGGVRWFHQYRFPDGTLTDGLRPLDVLEKEAAALFEHGVAGRSVLDIGAWDGFFSFEAERRGAARVLATDHFCWSGPGWGSKAGFDYAHAQFGSAVDSLDVDVFDLPDRIPETFDTVLFSGVLYHLADPLGGLAKAAAMSHDQLIVETVTACAELDYPALRFFPGDTLGKDPTNFFAPNTQALQAMLADLGFARSEAMVNPNYSGLDAAGMTRHIVHAWRSGG